MDMIWQIAKYILAGIFIFAGATIFTKSISRFINSTNKKEEDKEHD